MKNKAFTLLESTVVLLVTTLIIGSAITFTSLNRSYQKFNEERLNLFQDIKNLANLSLKGGEFVLNNNTSTVCGVGLLYSSSTKTITFIAYATVSTNTVISCYEIASSSIEEFNFVNKSPNIYLTKNFEYTTNSENAFKKELSYITKLDFNTNTSPIIQNFATFSLMFLSLSSEPIIFIDNMRFFVNFKDFNINLYFRNEEASKIIIKKTGQTLLQ